MSDGYVGGGGRVTRKRHVCAYCIASIPAETLAHWWAWSDGGVATTYYAHPECVEMGRTVNTWEDELMNPADFRAVCEEEFAGDSFPWSSETSTTIPA